MIMITENRKQSEENKRTSDNIIYEYLLWTTLIDCELSSKFRLLQPLLSINVFKLFTKIIL